MSFVDCLYCKESCDSIYFYLTGVFVYLCKVTVLMSFFVKLSFEGSNR